MLSFASANGNLFNVIGKLGALVKNARSYQGTQRTALVDTSSGVVAQLNSEPDIQALIGGAYIGQLNPIGSSIGILASNVAQQILNRKVYEDNPQISQSLQQLNINTSINELIRQMKIAGASVLAMTVTATPSLFTSILSNVGNGVITTSTKRPFDGLTLENSFGETLLLTCTSDSYGGTATAGNEGFRLTGTAQANYFDFNWPLGSNCQSGLSAINGNASNSQGNGLTNSGFETWSGNQPAQFVVDVGTVGTQVFREDSLTFDPAGTHALRLLGDGSTLTTLSQAFNSSTGTLGQLSPQTQYSANLWMRRDGSVPAQGQLTVELTDGAGATINDMAGVANAFTVNLTTLTTVYTAYNGVFRTPLSLPSGQKIRLRMPAGNALSAGRSVYADRMGMGLMTKSYTSGPYVAIHSGSTPFATNDYTTIAITNSRGAGGTLSSFQVLMSQLFPQMIANEFLLPSSSTPNLSDGALIA